MGGVHRLFLTLFLGWHTRLMVFMELYVNDIYAPGTVRYNRKFYPNELSKTRQPNLSRVQTGYYKHRSRGPMTAGDLYNYLYVNFLSMSHFSLLLDGSLATVQRKDGTNKTDVPGPHYFPDYIKYMRTLTGGSTGGTGQCYLEEVKLRPGGEFFTFQNAVS